MSNYVSMLLLMGTLSSVCNPILTELEEKEATTRALWVLVMENYKSWKLRGFSSFLNYLFC